MSGLAQIDRHAARLHAGKALPIVVWVFGLIVEEPGAGDDVTRLLVAEGERQAVIDPQVALGADMEDAFARLCREDAAGRIA